MQKSQGTAKPQLVEMRNVDVELGGKRVLRDIDLLISRGESTAILGPNGAGKTTLLRLVTRELYPRRRPNAVMKILGRERWNVFELREHIGFVSQHLQMRYLLVGATQRRVRSEDVVHSGFFSSVGIYPHQNLTPAHREKSREIMRLLEIEHLATRDFPTLSSGEQRRFLLGRALVNDPHTLVLDEPTSSLDLQAAFRLLALLNDLSRSRTLLLVTHHLGEIPPEISRVVLLDRGRIAFDGDKREALTSARMSELYGVALSVVERDGFYQALPIVR